MSDLAKPTLPVGRYGSRRPGGRLPRWAAITVLVGGVVGGAVLAVVLYFQFGAAPISGSQASYTVLGDGAVKIEFDVTRQTPDRPAMCIVRARDRTGAEVGRKEVYVAPGTDPVTVSTVLRTAKRPVTGEVDVCSYQVPPYLSTSTGDARPSG